MRAFIREWRTKETGKLEYSLRGLMKRAVVIQEYERLRSMSRGSLARPGRILFCVLLSLEMRRLLQVHRKSFTWGFCELFQRRRAKERLEWLSCFYSFLKFLRLKIFNMLRCHILGYCILNLIILISSLE